MVVLWEVMYIRSSEEHKYHTALQVRCSQKVKSHKGIWGMSSFVCDVHEKFPFSVMPADAFPGLSQDFRMHREQLAAVELVVPCSFPDVIMVSYKKEFFPATRFFL